MLVLASRIAVYLAILTFAAVFAMEIRDLSDSAAYFPYLCIAAIGILGVPLMLMDVFAAVRGRAAAASTEPSPASGPATSSTDAVPVAAEGASLAREVAIATKAGQATDDDIDDDIEAGKVLRVTLPLFLLCVLYVFTMESVGTLIASCAFVLCVSLLLGARSWWKIGLAVVIVAILVEFLFRQALGVSLP